MQDFRSGIFFLSLSAFVIWESLHMGLGTSREPGSGFLSFFTAAVLVPLSLALIIKGWRGQKVRKPLSQRVILSLAFIFSYGLILNTLGFLVATFIFIGILFRLGEKRPWWFLLGGSFLVTCLFYFVFGILLGVYFPKGILGM